jgi:hypothetical protein
LVEPENAGGDWRSVLAINIPGGWAVVCAHRMLLDIHEAMRNGLCSDETLSCIWEASYLVLYCPSNGFAHWAAAGSFGTVAWTYVFLKLCSRWLW